MNLKRKYLMDSIRQIKKFLGVNSVDEMEDSGYESKSIYLKKDDDVVGLHSIGENTENGWFQMEAWCNAYDAQFKFIASIYRLFGPIEDEAAELKKEGWTEVHPPNVC